MRGEWVLGFLVGCVLTVVLILGVQWWLAR